MGVCIYVCASKRVFDLGLYLCFRCVLSSSLQGKAFFFLFLNTELLLPFMLSKPYV